MQVEILPDAEAVAQRASQFIAEAARTAIAARGRFCFAVSGGRTPWKMLAKLATEKLPWDDVYLFQVDERIAPEGDPDRNWTHLCDSFLNVAPLPKNNVRAMPVNENDLEAAARTYAETLREIVGVPAILDLVHLGLGPDGHTASLIPNDGVLQVSDRDVATTGVYQGRRRMTLTFPMLNRARHRLWVVTGNDKHDALAKLRAADSSIPAGRVNQELSLVLSDRE